VLEYSRDLFEPSTVWRIVERFAQLLGAATLAPERALSSLPLLGAGEEHQVLREWNDSGRVYTAPPLLHQIFERQAAKTPAAEALRYAGRSWSYGEVDRQANRVAHGLCRLGVGPEVPVAIFLERSPAVVVCLLGVLKAG